MSGGLWHRPTQIDLLISKLRDARIEGRPLELPEMMRLGIAQPAVTRIVCVLSPAGSRGTGCDESRG